MKKIFLVLSILLTIAFLLSVPVFASTITYDAPVVLANCPNSDASAKPAPTLLGTMNDYDANRFLPGLINPGEVVISSSFLSNVNSDATHIIYGQPTESTREIDSPLIVLKGNTM